MGLGMCRGFLQESRKVLWYILGTKGSLPRICTRVFALLALLPMGDEDTELVGFLPLLSLTVSPTQRRSQPL